MREPLKRLQYIGGFVHSIFETILSTQHFCCWAAGARRSPQAPRSLCGWVRPRRDLLGDGLPGARVPGLCQGARPHTPGRRKTCVEGSVGRSHTKDTVTDRYKVQLWADGRPTWIHPSPHKRPRPPHTSESSYTPRTPHTRPFCTIAATRHKNTTLRFHLFISYVFMRNPWAAIGGKPLGGLSRT